MAGYVGALDQGTTSTRFIIFDHAGDIVGFAQKEHEQIFPRPGWVEHDPLEIWKNAQEVIARALLKTGIRGQDLDGHRDHEPEGDHGPLGQKYGKALWPCHCLAVHANGQALPRADQGWWNRPVQRQNGPPGGHLFLRPENQVDTGSPSRGASRRPSRRRVLRDHGDLVYLAAHGRPGRGRPRNRCDQRQPHHAYGFEDPGLG